MLSVKVNYECVVVHQKTEFSTVFKIKSSNLLNIGYIYVKIKPYFFLMNSFIKTKFVLEFYFFCFDEYEKNDLYEGDCIAHEFDLDFEHLGTVVFVVEDIFNSIEKLQKIIQNKKIDLTTEEKLEEIKVEFLNQCRKYGIKCQW